MPPLLSEEGADIVDEVIVIGVEDLVLSRTLSTEQLSPPLLRGHRRSPTSMGGHEPLTHRC